MDSDAMDARVRACLQEVNDPELGENIVDLGLVHRIAIEGGRIEVVMTVTSPSCPIGELLASQARAAIRRGVPEVEDVDVQMVLFPRWHPGLMSEAARRRLGWG